MFVLYESNRVPLPPLIIFSQMKLYWMPLLLLTVYILFDPKSNKYWIIVNFYFDPNFFYKSRKKKKKKSWNTKRPKISLKDWDLAQSEVKLWICCVIDRCAGHYATQLLTHTYKKNMYLRNAWSMEEGKNLFFKIFFL